MREPGKVYLVGAGPGDPKLLTLRAAELIATAEVLAYDLLVSDAILARAPQNALRLAVGRRHGGGQTDFRLHPEVLVQARAGRQVVRLKCGDPMIFGRGGEEAEELHAAGIAFEVVPGISAALGAAAAAGIPLTHRLLSSDVTWLTGHDVLGQHRSHSNWPHVAAGQGTLVIFMVGRALEANLQRLVAAGRPAQTPAAYVAAATCDHQEVVVGSLADLHRGVRHLDPGIPALLIVGEVVRLHATLAPSVAAYAAAWAHA